MDAFALPTRVSSGVALAGFLLVGGCHSPASTSVPDAQSFLDDYTAEYQRLYYRLYEAEWASNTRIVEGDTTNAERTRAANEAFAAFTGSAENIGTARRLLEQGGLEEGRRRQLELVLFEAGAYPQTVPELVRERIAAETAQNERLYGFSFALDGRELTPNEIDTLLIEETDLAKRRAVWEASKAIGPTLRDGLGELRRLRNACVQALGYDDFFSYMVSEYGMTTAGMSAQMEQINRELRPLYRELHTWARHELAGRYGEAVPALLPAHWLPNRWGQDWSPLVGIEGLDLDAALAARGPEWMVRQAERFYMSLGFAPLPEVFWEKSSLYPVPADAPHKKNNHASAWHLDLEQDVRGLFSVAPDLDWYGTVHHELGHIYYYLSYSRPEVPLLLRRGADRAWHEAIGTLMELAATQPRFLAEVGLAEEDSPVAGANLAVRQLLWEALDYVVFTPFSCGTMYEFERELYADELPSEEWNARWWDLARRYQGIVPPAPRDERFCDAATKTHINDDPAAYYDYALSTVLLFQLHDHIAREILHQDPHDTNYFGRRDVGDFLRGLLAFGGSVDSQELLREATGSELSARAMVEYFAPLQAWLEEQNAGRSATLPEL